MSILFQPGYKNKSAINRIFDLVANVLNQTASALGMTYNQINIVVYYLVIPLSWAVMLDMYIHMPIASLVVGEVWMFILLYKWRSFSEWCDWLFDKSVQFLLYFNRWGGYYNLTSVIICVVIPLLIYGILVYLLMC